MLAFTLKSKRKRLLSDSRAAELVAKFFDGTASIDEERLLYDYFAAGEVSDDLRHYTEMFGWYASLQPETCKKSKNKAQQVAFIAASVAVAVGVALSVIYALGVSRPLSLEDQYAGSYVIVNGQKIADIDTILPLLQRNEHYVDSTLMACVTPTYDNYDQVLIANAVAGIKDPDVLTDVLDILSD